MHTTSTRILLERTQTMTERQITQTVESAIISRDNGDPKPLDMLKRIATMKTPSVSTSQKLIRDELVRRGELEA